MLIEADHRGESALLTVSNRELTALKNFYIIGMMDTAGRGLAPIDYALRRRFVFFDMVPALGHSRFLNSLPAAATHIWVLLLKHPRRGR